MYVKMTICRFYRLLGYYNADFLGQEVIGKYLHAFVFYSAGQEDKIEGVIKAFLFAPLCLTQITHVKCKYQK